MTESFTRESRVNFQIPESEPLVELSFIKKPFPCKIGLHEWDSIFDGKLHIMCCKKCYKRHWIYGKNKK